MSHTHTHTQTDKYFPEIVKSCSGHPSNNTSKIGNRKFAQKQYFLQFIREKGKKKNLKFVQIFAMVKYLQKFSETLAKNM